MNIKEMFGIPETVTQSSPWFQNFPNPQNDGKGPRWEEASSGSRWLSWARTLWFGTAGCCSRRMDADSSCWRPTVAAAVPYTVAVRSMDRTGSGTVVVAHSRRRNYSATVAVRSSSLSSNKIHMIRTIHISHEISIFSFKLELHQFV